MSGKRPHRWLRTLILLAALLSLSLPAGATAKLIHMQNGKVLRAKAVEQDGDWLMATLDGDHTLGIQADTVDRVEDDLGDDNDFGANLNVVTSGRYVPKGRSGGFSNRQGGRARARGNLEEASETPRPSQPQPAGAVAVPGGVTVPPGQNPGPGQQPGTGVQQQPGLNLTPGINRRPGLRNRPNNN